MRVKHQFLPPSQARRIWLLALGIALAPCLMAPVWAENFNLESVDFSDTDAGMRIVLHTGSIVPVQKVLISDSKVILDIDQVNAGETVRTNFSGASNVSHVIMQPLNDHKIRMIIRGDGLSAPTVAFYGAGSSSDGGGLSAEESARLSMETNAALHRQQDAGMQSAVNTDKSAKSQNGVTPAVDNLALQDEPIAFGGFVDGKSGHGNGKLDLKPTETGILSLHTTEAPGVGSDVLAQMTSGKLDKYIPYGLLALVMLGAGVFVRHKLTQLNPAAHGFEDLLEEQQHGKKASFREMADAYRNKHDDKRVEPANNRKNHADSMIGLRGLHQQELDDIMPAPRPPLEAEETSSPNTLEQILAAMQAANQPKKPMGVPAPKKQAVNQYMQAQAPKGNAKSRHAADEAMLQEMKRAQVAQQELQQQARKQNAAQANKPGYTPVNRAAAAKKAVKTPTFQTVPSGNAVNSKNPTPNRAANVSPNPAPTQRGYAPVTPKAAANPPSAKPAGQAPLQAGNPEVLNFLRNVAELMEKDGKGDIAKSIHKNLGTKNLGLTQ